MKKVFVAATAFMLFSPAAFLSFSSSVFGLVQERQKALPTSASSQNASISETDSCSKIPELVNAIYIQVLERPAGIEALKEQSAKLARNETSVREIIREIALSPEYENRFISQRTPEAALKLLYQHLLARGTQPPEYKKWIDAVKARNFAAVINGLVDSAEYTKEFGSRSVPGRPVALRGCQFPATIKQHDVIANGQHMTTELTISGDGHIKTKTQIMNLAVLDGFCGKVGFWLLDEHDKVIDVIGPSSDQTWCVKGKNPGPSERTEEWQSEIAPDKLNRTKALAIIHAPANANPLSLTGENSEKARQTRQSLN